jgi:hypothetical protein
MSLLLLAAMKRFTGNPIRLANRPAVMLPKLPLGTLTTISPFSPALRICA